MHRKFIVLTLTLLPGVLAQSPPPATKVAVVNGQSVLVGTREGKKAYEQLKTRFGAKKKEFDLREGEITQLQDQFDRGGTVMSDDKRAQLADNISEKKKRLQRDMQDATDESQKEQQQVFQPIESRVDALMNKYAADHGYSVVLDFSVPGSPVRYAATGADITNEVIALYDTTYGEGPAAGKP